MALHVKAHTHIHTHTTTQKYRQYTITDCVLLRLAWLHMAFVIDGFYDWCCETGGALKWANLHCLLQDYSLQWTPDDVRNCHHHPQLSINADNNDDKWCLHSTCQVLNVHHHQCDGKSGDKWWIICTILSHRWLFTGSQLYAPNGYLVSELSTQPSLHTATLLVALAPRPPFFVNRVKNPKH